MKNYLKIAEHVDVGPLLLEVQRQPKLWDKNPARLNPQGPHAQTHDIWLRFKDETENAESGNYDSFKAPHVSVWYPPYYALPAARTLIFGLMSRVEGEILGGVLIYSIPPGARILPHIDHGWHVDYFEKFNICLQSNPQTRFIFRANGEEMVAARGDVHHFFNNVEHEVVNDGQDEHIVMTVCIHTHDYEARVKDDRATSRDDRRIPRLLHAHHNAAKGDSSAAARA
jgi:hypothetical protein